MIDPGSVSAALSGIKTALEIAKGLRGADVALAKAELKLKIADLTEALLAARESVLEASEEIHRLKAQVSELEQHQVDSRAMASRGGVLYRKAGDEEEGPFCQLCWMNYKQAVSLVRLHGPISLAGKFRCPQCQKHMGSDQ